MLLLALTVKDFMGYLYLAIPMVKPFNDITFYKLTSMDREIPLKPRGGY